MSCLASHVFTTIDLQVISHAICRMRRLSLPCPSSQMRLLIACLKCATRRWPNWCKTAFRGRFLKKSCSPASASTNPMWATGWTFPARPHLRRRLGWKARVSWMACKHVGVFVRQMAVPQKALISTNESASGKLNRMPSTSNLKESTTSSGKPIRASPAGSSVALTGVSANHAAR